MSDATTKRVITLADVEIRIVKPRETGSPSCAQLDFDDNDAFEWGRFALFHQRWVGFCDTAKPEKLRKKIEVAIVIAAPDGRTAVWFGQISSSVHALRAREDAATWVLDDYAAAQYWNPRSNRSGARRVTEFALAALRMHHAFAFAYTPEFRDTLLAQYADLDGKNRPDTEHVLRASTETLEAAAVLLDIQDYRGARDLLAHARKRR